MKELEKLLEEIREGRYDAGTQYATPVDMIKMRIEDMLNEASDKLQAGR
jgi:hypothetical protein